MHVTDMTKDIVRQVGLRVTPSRLAIYQVVKDSKKPVDIQQIFDLLKRSDVNVDQATVYRVLEAFIEKGLVEKVFLSQNRAFFEVAESEHHHITCTSCGKIEDITDCAVEKLEGQIEKKKGFRVVSHSLEFFGLCPKCKSNIS